MVCGNTVIAGVKNPRNAKKDEAVKETKKAATVEPAKKGKKKDAD